MTLEPSTSHASDWTRMIPFLSVTGKSTSSGRVSTHAKPPRSTTPPFLTDSRRSVSGSAPGACGRRGRLLQPRRLLGAGPSGACAAPHYRDADGVAGEGRGQHRAGPADARLPGAEHHSRAVGLAGVPGRRARVAVDAACGEVVDGAGGVRQGARDAQGQEHQDNGSQDTARWASRDAGAPHSATKPIGRRLARSSRLLREFTETPWAPGYGNIDKEVIARGFSVDVPRMAAGSTLQCCACDRW